MSDDLPPFDPRGLDPEQVRRLIDARVRHLKRLQAEGKVPPEHFNCRSSFIPLFQGVANAVIKQAFERARMAIEDRAAGIPQGEPDDLGSWSDLEECLGADVVERLRNGKPD